MTRHQTPADMTVPADGFVTERCEQCGIRDSRAVLTEYGLLCSVCAFRQHEHDARRDTYAYLTPGSLGFLSDTE